MRGAIADLREILSSSQPDPHESLKLISQIETTVTELEGKYRDIGIVFPVAPAPIVV